jgi:transmembrane sensor
VTVRRRGGLKGDGAGAGAQQPVVTPDIAAEASVWVARLHGPNRSVRMERECLAWQSRSAAHRLAFERCTDTWQDVVGVTLSSYAKVASVSAAPASVQRAGRLAPMRWGLALSAVVVVGVLLQPWRAADAYETGVGEQRLVVLQDGTRMSLNTATRVRVAMASAQRTVSVEGGEALFEVAKDVHRPFVVQAAGTEVVATGTAFLVQLTPGTKISGDALAVTLVEGQVVLRSSESGQGKTARPALARPVVMAAGARVRLERFDIAASRAGAAAPVQVDRPHVDQLLAWKRGEAAFEDVSLFAAVAEMNRYSAEVIKLEDAAALGGLRVSGVFRTGANASFARAVAKLHGLTVREHAGSFVLAEK